MEKTSKRYGNYKKIVYSEGSTRVYSTRKPAKLKTLLNLLKDKSMTRKKIREETGWTRGQIAGILHRNGALFDIDSGHISLSKNPYE